MSLVLALVSDGSTPHADSQDAVNADATVVVRWSQLAHDNAFALDPAMTDPFPNARDGP